MSWRIMADNHGRSLSGSMPYGVIRWMRGMQDDVNKRRSKALYILSTNKVLMTNRGPQC
jgi:hypothetical protein